MDKLQDYLNGIELPKVKTDVEVQASTSTIITVFGAIFAIYILFKK